MEKRNFTTSYRTPNYGTIEKEASFDDEAIDECVSELTKKAVEEDEKSDKDLFENK